MIKIAFFSFADIDNYGDILFSHIFKMEMEKRLNDHHIDFYCPSGKTIEGINYQAFEKEKIDGEYDALILAGGEVIHFYDERTWIPIYNKNNMLVRSLKPSDIVWDWSDCSAKFKAWLSVGVRPFSVNDNMSIVDQTINNLDYISVRGNLSKKILENAIWEYNNSKIEITPDLGWLFPSYLDYVNKRGKYYKEYIKEEQYVLFQINNITEKESDIIASQLIEFQQHEGLKVYLMPIIRPWEDLKYLEMISFSSNGKLQILPSTLNSVEMADIIIHAKGVVSSSLHMAITALSDNVPAAIVNKWHGTKLQDIFGHQYRLNALCHDIEKVGEVLLKVKNNMSKVKSIESYSTFMKQRLEEMFDEIALKLQD